MPILDFFDDYGKYFEANTGDEGKDWLTATAWREPDGLLDRDFALILVGDNGNEIRKFASYDDGSVGLSVWYLMHADAQRVLPPEAVKVAATNLCNSCLAHGVQIPLQLAYLKGQDVGEKVASIIDERRVHFGGFLSEPPQEEILKTAYDFIEHARAQWHDLDPLDRREIALNLEKVANDDGADIPEFIRRYSGETLSPVFSARMAYRAEHYGRTPELAENYDRLSKMAGVMALDEVVEALYLLDDTAGIVWKYGDTLPDPYLTVYEQPKEAEWRWSSRGKTITQDLLTKAASSPKLMDKMASVFEDSVVAGFKLSPREVFESMSDIQKEIAAKLLVP